MEKLTYENCWLEAKNQLDSKESALNKRKAEITKELTKGRGTAKITPKQLITVFENGSGVVTALDLVSYHKAVLPDGFEVRGEGEDAVENYAKTLIDEAQVMIALFSAFAGKQNEYKDLDTDCVDDPENTKVYRINFLVNGEDSKVSVNFLTKTIEATIEDSVYYQLKTERTPSDVANFIQIVISAIVGICPSIDLTCIEHKIAKVAYGVVSEKTIEADNHICTITGGTKQPLEFTIKPVKAK